MSYEDICRLVDEVVKIAKEDALYQMKVQKLEVQMLGEWTLEESTQLSEKLELSPDPVKNIAEPIVKTHLQSVTPELEKVAQIAAENVLKIAKEEALKEIGRLLQQSSNEEALLRVET